jgi:hypothetical protein
MTLASFSGLDQMDGGEATKSWRFEAWIFAYPLNRNTVLDYFKHSEFYDRQVWRGKAFSRGR